MSQTRPKGCGLWLGRKKEGSAINNCGDGVLYRNGHLLNEGSIGQCFTPVP